ncbi:hypothetical protein ACFFMN_15785 [Planobispora siamensis]|uniref:Uncharacterized protein n=1 Tax=Planobispora siamensis TaxID=936338 RepID=A0A8J3WLS2_9ACTN|nr:hypothetical protein [Planobispora siamensis]GIH93920.1 hypothetical protein Psi01_45500 [Planobispora siamensis]
MLPTPTKTGRFLPTLLLVLALIFIVRQPEKAANFATSALNGLIALADAIGTFASNFG